MFTEIIPTTIGTVNKTYALIPNVNNIGTYTVFDVTTVQ